MATLLPSISSDEEDSNNKLEENDDSSDDEVDSEFEFGGILGEDGGDFLSSSKNSGWSYQSALDILEQNDSTTVSAAVPRMDVASIIAAKRKHLKSSKRVTSDDEEHEKEESDNDGSSDPDSESDSSKHSESDSDDGSSGSSDEEEEAVDDAKVDMEDDTLKTRAGQDESEDSGGEADEEEKAKAAAYFENTSMQPNSDIQVFSQLTLSRPLLRGVAAMGFVRPTPIQASVIPVALAGRDVCASAVTGSGKTAAFLLPVLERLFQRAAGGTRAIILTPTRELAAQCYGMLTTIAQFTKIRACLIVGGAKNVNAQAAELRTRPDVIVATPGRLLDHVTNSQGVTIDDVEFLVLDEADRLLDLGFQDEVHEIVRSCPTERQTLLFSATMTTRVDDLIKLSLKRPVRVKVSDKNKSRSDVEVAPRLEQEFVRVRAGNEGISREGMLLALLTRTFTTRTIVFFDTKSTAHRLMILCGLCGIKCAELHGNLSQTQRLSALEDFRKGDVDILLATDLAARGLDIDRVQTVINFEMPSQVETYIHRIGRTARAGRGGKSCTLIGEGRRHLMKAVIKDAEQKQAKEKLKGSKTGVIRSRTIPPAVVAHFVEKIKSLQHHVDEVMQAEAVAKLDRIAEMEAVRAQNIIEHADEIKSRPQREWFASNKQKQSTKEAAAERSKRIADAVGTGKHRMTRKKRRAREAREEMLQYQEEQREQAEENGQKGKKIVTEESMKVSARAVKKRQAQAEKVKHNTSIHDEDAMMKKKAKENARKKKRKGAFATDAAGDSGLFDDEKVTHAKKPKSAEKERLAKDGFRGYDPSMEGKKKPKVKAHHAFKSKSKYKRKR